MIDRNRRCSVPFQVYAVRVRQNIRCQFLFAGISLRKIEGSMRAVVFVNGQVSDYEALRLQVRTDDYLVGADGGALHALATGLATRCG